MPRAAKADTLPKAPARIRAARVELRLTRWWLAAAFVLTAGTALYFAQQYATLRADPSVAAERETRALVASVGKLMFLPDEVPTIARVTDATQLRDEAFFAGAQDGDVLLAFAESRQAILYRPSAGRIVAVAPIVLDTAAP